ncbi:MAG: hypothetical protein DRJ13_06235 [Bacteroidetes bacterium]|nr:MAG: hypothetical protein DRJ13_06235 [Bacteroidota bacterium]
MPANSPYKRFVAVARLLRYGGHIIIQLVIVPQKTCLAIWRLLIVELNPAAAGWFQIKST